MTSPTTIEKGDFIEYNVGDGETISAVKEITTYGAVTAYADGGKSINLVQADGKTVVGSPFKNELADNAKIIYVNTKDTKGVEGGKIPLAMKDTDDTSYIANVVYVIPSSGDNANKVTWLFVDTNNDLEKVDNPVAAANKAQEANNAEVAKVLAVNGANTSFLHGMTALTGIKNAYLSADITNNNQFDVGTPLTTANTKVTVTAAKLDTDDTIKASADLSSKTFVAASAAAVDSSNVKVQVTPGTMGANTYTAYTLTVTAVDVPGATVEQATQVVTVVVLDTTA